MMNSAAQPSTERPVTGTTRTATAPADASVTAGIAAVAGDAWQRMFGDTHSSDLKLAMAASGTVLSVFTVGHMAGNLQVYLVRDHYNEYAEFLRTVGAPVLPRNSVLWVVRIGLIGSAATHVLAGTELTLRAMSAEGRAVADALRPITWRVGAAAQKVLRGGFPLAPPPSGTQRYRKAAFNGAFLASRSDSHAPRQRPRGRRRSVPRIIARSMRSTGAVLGLFTVYHVLDLTAGARPAASVSHTHGDAYGNLVASLSRPSVAVFYTASMAALAGHMIHGLRTAAMDTGVTGTARRVRQVDTIAKAVGGVVALGNVSIPVAVLTKVVR
ncbi:succinate dehydrogenase cytochrome b subunit [Streptomyces sp. tea 10]|nr:succinate dehydrogenase cytochrome b subunit [Streptomyces sp. tea 10]